MRTYQLITNCSNHTYWSYIGTVHNTSGFRHDAATKYGTIFVNNKGGWFTKEAIKTIHKTVIQDDFPTDVTIP